MTVVSRDGDASQSNKSFLYFILPEIFLEVQQPLIRVLGGGGGGGGAVEVQLLKKKKN